MSVPDVESLTVRSFDGTGLDAHRFTGGDGVPVVLADAFGSNLAIWRSTIEELTTDREVVTWDHRGLFGSEPPATKRLDPAAQAQDALAVARSCGYERFHLVGWSSGGRIALQIAHDHPERVVSLSLVCAGYGHSLAALRRLELSALLPRIAGVAKYLSGPIHGLLRNFVARPEVAGLVRQSGMIAASADTTAFIGFLKGLADADARVLLETYEAVSGDPGAHLLREIVAPTLVIAGSNDQFTSRAVTTEIVAKIADARLEVYEDSSHYLPIEHTAHLAEDLRRFFKETEHPLR